MVADLRRRVGLFNPFPGLLLAALLAANAGNARAQDDGPYPVWFPDDIGIVSLDEIPAALRAPFAPGDEIQFEKRGFVRWRGSPPLIWATNCNEYMVYDEGRIYRRRIENDRIGRQVEIWEAHDLRCYVLRALRQARPAERSFLRDFVMDERAQEFLPDIVDADCRNVRALIAANIDGIPILPPDRGAPPPDPDLRRVFVDRGDNHFVERLFVKSRLFAERRISIVGRGDFDGDELDDVLLLLAPTFFDPGRPRTQLVSLIVATRFATGTVMRATSAPAPWFECSVDIQDQERRERRRRLAQ